MKVLRPWSEEGASIRELSLVEVSRRERPDAGSRARALGAALAELGVGRAAEITTSETTKGSPARMSATGIFTRFGILKRPIGLGFVAAAAMGAVALSHVQRAVVGPNPPTTAAAPVRPWPSAAPRPAATAPAFVSQSPTNLTTLANHADAPQSSASLRLEAWPAPRSVDAGGVPPGPVQATALPPPSTRTVADCNPPYTADAKGHIHFKPGCL